MDRTISENNDNLQERSLDDAVPDVPPIMQPNLHLNEDMEECKEEVDDNKRPQGLNERHLLEMRVRARLAPIQKRQIVEDIKKPDALEKAIDQNIHEEEHVEQVQHE